MIDRLQTRVWAHVDSTLQDMAAASSVNSILQRQANAMDAILASFEQPRPAVLLPGWLRSACEIRRSVCPERQRSR